MPKSTSFAFVFESEDAKTVTSCPLSFNPSAISLKITPGANILSLGEGIGLLDCASISIFMFLLFHLKFYFYLPSPSPLLFLLIYLGYLSVCPRKYYFHAEHNETPYHHKNKISFPLSPISL